MQECGLSSRKPISHTHGRKDVRTWSPNWMMTARILRAMAAMRDGAGGGALHRALVWPRRFSAVFTGRAGSWCPSLASSAKGAAQSRGTM
jgi:hypothetical protein